MTSTEFNIGLTGSKSSSRVLKPPGGGHTDIFGAPENRINNPRPKYDQQNSSNLNFCMNTTDPNLLVEQVAKGPSDDGTPAAGGGPAPHTTNGTARPPPPTDNIISAANSALPPQPKGRVPPGGFSSGLW